MRGAFAVTAALVLSGCYGFVPPPHPGVCKDCMGGPYAEFREQMIRATPAPYRIGGERTKRAELTDAYLRLGDELLAIKDYGGAARAYWATTYAVSGSKQSRQMREIKTSQAFDGLAKVAEARGQHDWAGMMELCASVSSVWAMGPEGEAEGNAYDAAEERINDARQAAAEEAQKARDAAADQALMAQFRASNGMASVDETLNSYSEIQEQRDSADIAMMKFEMSASAKEASMNRIVDAQFLDVDQQRRFIAERVADYLQRAQDAEPYVKRLRSIADTHKFTELAAALKPLEGQPALGAGELQPVVDQIVALETNVTKRERVFAKYTAPDLERGMKEKADAEAAAAAYKQKLPEIIARYRNAKLCGSEDTTCEAVYRCRELRDPDSCARAVNRLGDDMHDPNSSMQIGKWACGEKMEAACVALDSYVWGRALKDDVAAAALLKERCNSGSGVSCGNYGNLVSWEKTTEPKTEAAVYFERGCAVNDAQSCFMRAVEVHYSSPNPKENLKKALPLYQKACDLKMEAACEQMTKLTTK